MVALQPAYTSIFATFTFFVPIDKLLVCTTIDFLANCQRSIPFCSGAVPHAFFSTRPSAGTYQLVPLITDGCTGLADLISSTHGSPVRRPWQFFADESLAIDRLAFPFPIGSTGMDLRCLLLRISCTREFALLAKCRPTTIHCRLGGNSWGLAVHASAVSLSCISSP